MVDKALVLTEDEVLALAVLFDAPYTKRALVLERGTLVGSRLLEVEQQVRDVAQEIINNDRAGRRPQLRLVSRYVVHTHGPEDGAGLACPERVLADGRLIGACQPDPPACTHDWRPDWNQPRVKRCHWCDAVAQWPEGSRL